jgi:hypothetical protein
MKRVFGILLCPNENSTENRFLRDVIRKRFEKEPFHPTYYRLKTELLIWKKTKCWQQTLEIKEMR